jgi:hypothetical protein
VSAATEALVNSMVLDLLGSWEAYGKQRCAPLRFLVLYSEPAVTGKSEMFQGLCGVLRSSAGSTQALIGDWT